MGRLATRVALVTGAGQGIGAAILRDFAREGAAVVAIDRDGDSVRKVCEEVNRQGGETQPFVFDVTDHNAYCRCVDQVAATHGRIDVLVNNAAIVYYGDVFEDTLERWRSIQAVNLEAVYWGSKLVAPVMSRRRSGRIVNIASVQALATDGKLGSYCAAKGGVVSLTRSLAVELAPHGILVNAIAPGVIQTPMSVIDGVDETTTDLFETWYVRHRKIPLGRAGQPEEIARVAVFLASDDCSYVTGHTLVADGGLTITF